MTHEQITAVKQFSDGLLGCLRESSKKHNDTIVTATFDYVISLINLHTQLYEMSFDSSSEKEAEYFKEKKA